MVVGVQKNIFINYKYEILGRGEAGCSDYHYLLLKRNYEPFLSKILCIMF